MKAERIRDLVIFLREGSMHRHEDMEAAAALELLFAIVQDLAAFDDEGDEIERTEMICELIERALKALE